MFSKLSLIFLFTLLFTTNVYSELSATDSLKNSQFQGASNQRRFNAAAIGVFRQSLERFEYGSDCQGSCPVGCCSSSDPLMVEAAMYQFVAKVADDIAQKSHRAAVASCETRNQLNSGGSASNCASELEKVIPIPTDASLFDQSGNCIDKQSKECQFYVNILGGQIAKMNESKKTTFSNYFTNIKTNQDGSITLKLSTGSKTITANDFSDPKKLEKLGLSARKSQILSKGFDKLNTTLQQKSMQAAARVSSGTLQVGEDQNKIESLTKSNEGKTVLPEQEKPIEELFSKIGDEKIGHWKSDIFITINKRYEKLRSEKQFMIDSESEQ